MFRNRMKCRLCADYHVCKDTSKFETCEKTLQREVKTFKGWEGSLEEYIQPGDEIDEEFYEHFLNVSLPHTLNSNAKVIAGFQVSGPYSDGVDESGKTRALYLTFGMSEKKCYYLGLNFKGEINSHYKPWAHVILGAPLGSDTSTKVPGLNRILVDKGLGLTVDETLLNNGFIRNISVNPKQHELLREYFVSSPHNSQHLWDKDGRTYLFEQWNGDYPTQPSSITIADVTDILRKIHD